MRLGFRQTLNLSPIASREHTIQFYVKLPKGQEVEQGLEADAQLENDSPAGVPLAPTLLPAAIDPHAQGEDFENCISQEASDEDGMEIGQFRRVNLRKLRDKI